MAGIDQQRATLDGGSHLCFRRIFAQAKNLKVTWSASDDPGEQARASDWPNDFAISDAQSHGKKIRIKVASIDPGKATASTHRFGQIERTAGIIDQPKREFAPGCAGQGQFKLRGLAGRAFHL